MEKLLLATLLGGPPGTPIKKLPPFVTDTLFPAVGGKVPINRSRGFSPLGEGNEALTSAGNGDTSVVFYKDPTDHVYAHEMGHVLDHRGIAPQALAGADYGRERNHTGDPYFRNNRDEYVAEAFARAAESGRKGFKDSTAVEKKFPGAIALIRWLQTRPPFKHETKP